MVLVTTNDAKFYNLYLSLLSFLNTYNIKILNDESHRNITSSYSRSDFNQSKGVFQACINTGGRIFVFLVGSPGIFYVAEGLYDLGLRNGDIQLIYPGKVGGGGFSDGSSEEILTKRRAIFKGAVGVSNVE